MNVVHLVCGKPQMGLGPAALVRAELSIVTNACNFSRHQQVGRLGAG